MMDTRCKERLVESIESCVVDGTNYAGLALSQLAQDLKKDDKPIKVSYADITAFDTYLEERVNEWRNKEEQEGFQVPYGRLVSVRINLKDALKTGVLSTLDTVKERINRG